MVNHSDLTQVQDCMSIMLPRINEVVRTAVQDELRSAMSLAIGVDPYDADSLRIWREQQEIMKQSAELVHDLARRGFWGTAVVVVAALSAVVVTHITQIVEYVHSR